MRLQTIALEGGLSETEPLTPFPFGNDPAETLLDKGLQSCSLSVGQLASRLKKAIWYLYGCFHIDNHIALYTKMSTE